VQQGDLESTDAPWVVMVHGIGSRHTCYNSLANDFVKQKGYRVLRYDLYGRGRSECVNEIHNGELFVTQLHDLLEKLNITQKIILIGHSMGGAITVLFTQKYPDIVEKLILLTPAGLPWKLPSGAGILSIPKFGLWFFNVLASLGGQDKILAEGFWDVEYAKDALASAIKERQEANKKELHASLVNSIVNFPLTGCVAQATELSKHERPTLIIWAQYDTTVPSDVCFAQYHKLFGDKATYAIVKDTRHDFFNEEKEISSKLILSWLAGEEYDKLEIGKLRNPNSGKVELTSRDKKIQKFWKTHSEYDKFFI
jgi:pimeloyl-ACP methyl ester carboxylesterase